MECKNQHVRCVAAIAIALPALSLLCAIGGCRRETEASSAPSASPAVAAQENRARGMAAIDANASMSPQQKQALKDQLSKAGTKHP